MVQALYLARDRRAALVLNPLLKQVFERPRPAGDALVAASPARRSPSGHTTTATTIATALAVIAWPTRWRWPVIAAARRLLARHGRLARVPRRALAVRRRRRPRPRLHHRHDRAAAHAVALPEEGPRRTVGVRTALAAATTRHRRRLPRLGQHAHGRPRHARGPDEGLGHGGGGGRRAGGAAPPARPLPSGRRHQRRGLAGRRRAPRAREGRPGRVRRRRHLVRRRRRPQAQLRVLPRGAPARGRPRSSAGPAPGRHGRRRDHQRHRRRPAGRHPHHLVQPHQAPVPGRGAAAGRRDPQAQRAARGGGQASPASTPEKRSRKQRNADAEAAATVAATAAAADLRAATAAEDSAASAAAAIPAASRTSRRRTPRPEPGRLAGRTTPDGR